MNLGHTPRGLGGGISGGGAMAMDDCSFLDDPTDDPVCYTELLHSTMCILKSSIAAFARWSSNDGS